jgi:predicted esterase
MPSFETRSFATTTHGRYVVDVTRAGDAGGPRPLLVGFHGYGQSAEQHLDDLRRLDGTDGFVLVAVQALHLFYTRTGDVVGSWMTKLGREDAIADNVGFVRGVVARVRDEFGAEGPLVFAGFSQGASMAYRAAAYSGHACHGVLAVGGDLPPEMADSPLRLPPVLVLRGERDEWFTREKAERDLAAFARHRIRALSVVYDGGHEWSEAFFPHVAEFLREAAARK